LVLTMALRHALLGLLSEDRASGYELARQFERTPWRFAWHAEHSQIYPELDRMRDAGLIMVASRGPRSRRVYLMTQAGQDELRNWLRHPPDQFAVRNELVLRLLLLPTLDAPEARTLFAPIAEASGEELATLRVATARADAAAAPGAPVSWDRLTSEFSLRSVEALHHWAVWALNALDAG
jgi:PadR family transcriptional regulator, regulatory protein AphA